MGNGSKKWFILGLVGTITAGGGIVNIVTSFLRIMMANRSINTSIIAIILLYSLYSEMNGGIDISLLIQAMTLISRNNRTLAIYRLTFYIGIVTAIIGGILAIIGWINHFLQKKSEI